MKVIAGVTVASVTLCSVQGWAVADQVVQTEKVEATSSQPGTAEQEEVKQSPEAEAVDESGSEDTGNESEVETTQPEEESTEEGSTEEQDSDDTDANENHDKDPAVKDVQSDKKTSTSKKKDKTNKQDNSDTSNANTVKKTEKEKELEVSHPAVESDSTWTGDTAPSWADSDQEYIQGNLAVAEQIRALERELNDRVDRAAKTYALDDTAGVTYEDSNILDIFAVYAVLNDMTDDFPYEVEFTSENDREELLQIFNQMTRVNRIDSDSLVVRRLTYEDMAEEYGFDDDQKEALAQLVTDEARELLQEQYDTSILSQLTDEEFEEIQELIPEDASGARRSVLLAALSLEDKVNYFWGGKSYQVGWDERWGQQSLVTSEGLASQTGTVRSFGLDCSGFVTWAFINAGGDQSVLGYIGNGTATQWANSEAISWDEVIPGDLVFYKTPNSGSINHVGIVVSNGEDGIKIVHCSSGQNGVVVTGKVGFKYARRPYIYSE